MMTLEEFKKLNKQEAVDYIKNMDFLKLYTGQYREVRLRRSQLDVGHHPILLNIYIDIQNTYSNLHLYRSDLFYKYEGAKELLESNPMFYGIAFEVIQSYERLDDYLNKLDFKQKLDRKLPQITTKTKKLKL